jgi:hypothetical protein
VLRRREKDVDPHVSEALDGLEFGANLLSVLGCYLWDSIQITVCAARVSSVQSSPVQSIRILIGTSIAVQSSKSVTISVSERTIFLPDQLDQFA